MNELGSETTEDDNDMLWEAIKVDLGENRTYQAEQLQSLKGSSVKLPPSKRQARQRAKRISKERSKFHSKKAAIKTALGMIRAVTRKIKFKKGSGVSHDYTSVMNFKVYDNSPKIVGANEPHSSSIIENLPAEQDHGNQVQLGTTFKDEATQTKSLCLEEKASQINLEHISNFHCCDLVNACVDRQRKTCLPMFASPCTKPVINMCLCSASHQKSLPLEIHADRQVSLAEGNVPTQYTLKQICEELLVQLSTRKDILPDKQAAEENNNRMARECPGETFNSPQGAPAHASETLTDATVSDLKAIVQSLQSIQSDMRKSVIAPQHEALASITVARTETQSQSANPEYFKAVSLKPSPEGDNVTPKAVQTVESSHSSVTPDLLQLARQCSTIATPPEVKHQQFQVFKVPFPPAKVTEQLKDDLEKVNGLTQIPLEENSVNLLQQMLDAGLVTIVNSADKLESNASDVNQLKNESNKNPAGQWDSTTDNKNSDIYCNKAANSTDESANQSSSDDFVLVFDTEENHQTAKDASLDIESHNRARTSQICNSTPIRRENKCEETRIVSGDGDSNEPGQASSESSSNNIDILSTPKTSDNVAPSKILDCKQSASKDHSTTMDSAIFEEVDTTEMENILMVWRQQEQLHKDPKSPEITPSSLEPYLFKMKKRACDLPPGLKNVRIHQPPPLHKEQPLNTSVLQILDEEANKPLDEDEVPENSQGVLPTPNKKRKLSLRKNPPSPLPVVFHTKKPVTEKLETAGEDLPSGKGHSPSALTTVQVEKSKECTSEADDDDTPLSLRITSTIKNATNHQRKVESETSRKKGSGKIQTSVKKSERKSSKKVKSISVKESTENSKIAKSKNVQEPSKNSKKDKIISLEKPNENVKKEKCENADQTYSATAQSKKTISYDEIVAMAQNMHDKKQDFEDQIKERFKTMNKKWLQEKTDVAPEKEVVLQPNSAPPVGSEINPDPAFQEKTKKLRSISVYELGKAHDTAVIILLNPWRGINARRVTRDYEPPKHDSKCISRSLWDLRSGANPDDVVKRIMSMGWKDVDLSALKTMVSMFVLSLSRKVPFVIEAIKSGEEDDTCSTVSDIDHSPRKKATSVRVVATRHIFKGECIEGLNGLLLEPSERDTDKERLRTWVFPKFSEGRNFALLGPLAYLKRKEGNSNTEALILKGDIVIVKATRQILCGERLLLSIARLEKSFCRRTLQ